MSQSNGQHDIERLVRTLSAHLSDLTERITRYLQYVLNLRMGFVLVMWPEGHPDQILTASNAWNEDHAKEAVNAAAEEYDEDATNIITPSDATDLGDRPGGDDDG
jgi:hypothetical protein